MRHHLMRAPGEWTITALGLAMPGLRHALRTTLAHPGPDERDDIHADLIAGFLTRMSTIDVRRRNICGRLINAAVHQARTRQAKRRHEYPAIAGSTASSDLDPVTDMISAWQDFNALPLHPTDRQLIQMTRLQGHTIAEAAHHLGLTVTAATSRRSRAEQRLAAHYKHRDRRGIH
jgi:DNA-directed RNA polymerase specialized sigma24 family protein